MAELGELEFYRLWAELVLQRNGELKRERDRWSESCYYAELDRAEFSKENKALEEENRALLAKVQRLEMELDRSRSLAIGLAEAIREDFKEPRNAAYSILVHNEGSNPWIGLTD
jgi:hypothetical protein